MSGQDAMGASGRRFEPGACGAGSDDARAAKWDKEAFVWGQGTRTWRGSRGCGDGAGFGENGVEHGVLGRGAESGLERRLHGLLNETWVNQREREAAASLVAAANLKVR